MRKILTAIITAGALAAMASPAAAHWQWTKWGMTPADVAAASDGKIGSADLGSSNFLRIDGPLEFGRVRVNEVRLQFKDDRLARVFVESSTDQLNTIHQSLDAAMGPPVSVTPGRFASRVYADRVKGNMVSVIVQGETTTLMYEPIPDQF